MIVDLQMFSETNEIKEFFIHTALTLKFVLNLVLSALFLPIELASKFKKQTLNLGVVNHFMYKNMVTTKINKRVDNIKFNTNLTVQVQIHNSKCFKHLNLKVSFQEWKQHLKSPAFVDVASQQLHLIFEKWGHSGLNIFH